MQLRVKNFGGSPAHGIRLHWQNPILDNTGNPVHFSDLENSPEIPVLLPNESVAVAIGGAHAMYKQYQDMNYQGRIEFHDASGNKNEYPFSLSAETYRKTLTFDEEALKTHYEVQKIPDELKRLTREVAQLRSLLMLSREGRDESE